MISAAVIVRDAEASIVDAIRSLRGVADEVLVLDTGSADGTVQRVRDLANEWDAARAASTPDAARAALPPVAAPRVRVESWPWVDDFSAARNEAARRCVHDWIVVLDADEVLEEPGDLRAAILAAAADPEGRFSAASAYVACDGPDPDRPPDRFVVCRAYDRRRRHYIYPAHNQLVSYGSGPPGMIARTTAVIASDYSDGLAHRMARSVPILERLYAERPEDIHAPLFLARMHAADGNHAAALRWSEIACALCDPAAPAPGEVSAWVTRIHATGAIHGSMEATRVLAEALRRYPQAPDVWHCALSLTAQEWVLRQAAARGTTWEIGTEWPLVNDEDAGRVQGAFDALSLGLAVSVVRREAGAQEAQGSESDPTGRPALPDEAPAAAPAGPTGAA